MTKEFIAGLWSGLTLALLLCGQSIAEALSTKLSCII